ncbi:hypothetical protein B566_EDAN005908 [Ephemera danica]|nr:hypothetical protein B566_EDAN005908 [Ephemera danica]
MSQSDCTTSSSDDDSTNEAISLVPPLLLLLNWLQEEQAAPTASLTDVLSATTSSSSSLQVRNTQLVNCECVHVRDVVHINAPIVLTADLKTLNNPDKAACPNSVAGMTDKQVQSDKE